MVFEVTAGIGAVCGGVHRLGKLGLIRHYGAERRDTVPAGWKVLLWLHVLGFVGLIGNFDNFPSGLMFGLIFVGAWKLAEEVAEFLVDSFSMGRA